MDEPVITAVPGFSREAAEPKPTVPSEPAIVVPEPVPAPNPVPETEPEPEPESQPETVSPPPPPPVLAAEPEPEPEPEPVPETAPAPPAPPAAAPADDEEDLDFTRLAPVRTAIATLTWDDGTVSTIAANAVVGRNPDSPDDPTVLLVSMPDATRSLSKTHFALRLDGARVDIVDLHSTNGVAVVRAGVSERLAPGKPHELADGDVLTMGERTATIGWRHV